MIDSNQLMHSMTLQPAKSSVRQIKLTFNLLAAATSFTKLCKIGIFTDTLPPVQVHEPTDWDSIQPLEYDLLVDSSKSMISYPVLTIKPNTDDLTTTWKLHRLSDGVDIGAVQPTVFHLDANGLTITLDPSNLQVRLSWAMTRSFYFIGTVNTTPQQTVTSRFQFTVVFKDACRTSTITAKTLPTQNAVLDVSGNFDLQSGFTDSVDADKTLSYSQGICGEKRLTLDSGHPEWLSVAHESSSPWEWKFVYDSSKATKDSIGTHSIAYTVASIDYAGIVTSITGTVQVIIAAPNSITVNEPQTWSAVQLTFDLLADTSKSISLPSVTISPSYGWSVTWSAKSISTDPAINLVSTYPEIALTSSELVITHTVSKFDRRKALFGTIKQGRFDGITDTPTPQIVGSSGTVYGFEITFTDACQASTITPQSISLAVAKFEKSSSYEIAAFNDSVDATQQYALGICGEKKMKLADNTPSFLSLTLPQSEPLTSPSTLAFDHTKATDADARQHTISYTVETVEYASIVPILTGTFTFQIDKEPEVVETPEVKVCSVKKSEIDKVRTELESMKIELRLQAGQDGSVSASFQQQKDIITKTLKSFDEDGCGAIKYELKTASTSLQVQGNLLNVILLATKDTTEGNLTNQLKVTINGEVIEVPIEAELFSCKLESVKFVKSQISTDYEVGAGPKDISLPEIKQKPTCGEPLTDILIKSVEGTADNAQSAVNLDHASNKLTVETADPDFVGKSASFTIAVDQQEVADAGTLQVTVNFKAALPKFDLSSFTTDSITCGPSDAQWSLELPPIENADPSTTKVELLSSSEPPGFFVLEDSGTISIEGSQLYQLISGTACPEKIELIFSIKSGETESKESISIGVGNDSNDGTGSAKFAGWQTLVDQKNGSKGNNGQAFKGVEAEKKEPEKLLINKIEISQTSKLTIKFSKPIVDPNIKIWTPTDNEPAKPSGRLLKRLRDINDIIQVSIDAEGGDDSLDTSILELRYLGGDKQTMNVQMEFADVKAITPDIRDPDTLKIQILQPQAFIDEETGKLMDETSLNLSTPIQPQMTQQQFEQLVEMADTAAQVGIATSIWEVVMLFFFKKILFSLWILILMLQFFVFMALWQVRYPPNTRFLLFELRRIVLGEFMDDLEVGATISSELGIEAQESSAVDEDVGEKRLGPRSIFENFGPTLILGTIAFAVIVAILVVLIIFLKRFVKTEKGRTTIRNLKYKVFYNPIIRYLILNCLKLNAAAILVFSAEAPGGSDLLVSSGIMLMICLAPIIMCCVVVKYHGTLTKEENKKSFNALYEGRNIESKRHKAQLFPLAFFYRRTGFACATVLLFDYPVLQQASNGVLTLLYLIYLARDQFNFQSKPRQIVEIGTELLFLFAGTVLIQLSNPDYSDEDSSKAIEMTFFTSIGLLLILNTVYVVHTCILNKREAKRKKLREKFSLAEKVSTNQEKSKAKKRKKKRRSKTLKTSGQVDLIPQPTQVNQLEGIREEDEDQDSMRKSFIHRATQNDEDDQTEKPEDILFPYLPETSRKTRRKKTEIGPIKDQTKLAVKPMPTFGSDIEQQKPEEIENNLQSQQAPEQPTNVNLVDRLSNLENEVAEIIAESNKNFQPRQQERDILNQALAILDIPQRDNIDSASAELPSYAELRNQLQLRQDETPKAVPDKLIEISRN